MKKLTMTKVILAAALVVGLGTAANAQVIINEVYGGGGSGTGTPSYTRDFVELYNPSGTAFSLSGYALQYASSGGAFTNTIVLFGAGSIIGATDYLSVATGSAGAAGGTLAAGTGSGNVTYLAPNNSASISNSAGAVRLYNTATSTTIDVVGFGTVTQGTSPTTDPKFEVAAAPAPTNTASSLNRTGFVDSNNNSADFTNATPTPNAGTTSTVVAVPEPSTWACFAGGVVMLSLVIGRRRQIA